jgi:hypothetical protein
MQGGREHGMVQEKRQLQRRDFSLYMNVTEEPAGRILGILSDISTAGFKLEGKRAIPIHVNLQLRIQHTHEISNKRYMMFTARACWSERDPYHRSFYNTGFQIVDMTPADYDIFVQMFNSYGAKN